MCSFLKHTPDFCFSFTVLQTGNVGGAVQVNLL